MTLKTNTVPSIFNKQEVGDEPNCLRENLLSLNIFAIPGWRRWQHCGCCVYSPHLEIRLMRPKWHTDLHVSEVGACINYSIFHTSLTSEDMADMMLSAALLLLPKNLFCVVKRLSGTASFTAKVQSHSIDLFNSIGWKQDGFILSGLMLQMHSSQRSGVWIIYSSKVFFFPKTQTLLLTLMLVSL